MSAGSRSWDAHSAKVAFAASCTVSPHAIEECAAAPTKEVSRCLPDEAQVKGPAAKEEGYSCSHGRGSLGELLSLTQTCGHKRLPLSCVVFMLSSKRLPPPYPNCSRRTSVAKAVHHPASQRAPRAHCATPSPLLSQDESDSGSSEPGFRQSGNITRGELRHFRDIKAIYISRVSFNSCECACARESVRVRERSLYIVDRAAIEIATYLYTHSDWW